MDAAVPPWQHYDIIVGVSHISDQQVLYLNGDTSRVSCCAVIFAVSVCALGIHLFERHF